MIYAHHLNNRCTIWFFLYQSFWICSRICWLCRWCGCWCSIWIQLSSIIRTRQNTLVTMQPSQPGQDGLFCMAGTHQRQAEQLVGQLVGSWHFNTRTEKGCGYKTNVKTHPPWLIFIPITTDMLARPGPRGMAKAKLQPVLGLSKLSLPKVKKPPSLNQVLKLTFEAWEQYSVVGVCWAPGFKDHIPRKL